jgi:uncharacterized DUF497 family protein
MFDWDGANLAHIARHGITREEVEQALANDPTDEEMHEENGEERMHQVGITDALLCLGIVTTWRGDRLRVVTAYPATRAAEEFYWRRKRRQ